MENRVGSLELWQDNGRKSEHSTDDKLLERHNAGRKKLKDNRYHILNLYSFKSNCYRVAQRSKYYDAY